MWVHTEAKSPVSQSLDWAYAAASGRLRVERYGSCVLLLLARFGLWHSSIVRVLGSWRVPVTRRA